MRIGFVCCFDISVTHHAGKHLRSDTIPNGKRCKGMAAVVWSHIAAADLLHEFFEIPLTEINIIPIAFVSINEAGAAGSLGSLQQFLIRR